MFDEMRVRPDLPKGHRILENTEKSFCTRPKHEGMKLSFARTQGVFIKLNIGLTTIDSSFPSTLETKMKSDQEEIGKTLLAYIPRLIRLAERNMSKPLQVRVGADDLADSVIKSVFRAFSQGKLKVNLEDDEQFWKYLTVVSLNKIRRKARDNKSGKRDLTLDQSLSDLEYMISETSEPSDDEGKQLAEVLVLLESELDADSKLILEGKLQGDSSRIISMKLNGGQGVSTKTVTRRWNDIQEKLRSIIESLELA